MLEPRRVSVTGLELIESFETLRLASYDDGTGTLSIGWGHTGPDVTNDLLITIEDAERLLDADLTIAERAASDLVKVPLGENQYAALVCFVFNIGADAFANSSLLRNLNNGWFEQVPTQLMRWVNSKGKHLDGLVKRRSAESVLWTKPDRIA